MSPPSPTPAPGESPALSVVIAVLDEEENVRAVAQETLAALEGQGGGFEIVFVDDGSADSTPQILAEMAQADPRIRLVRHARRCGKSQAVRTGVVAARGEWVGTLDGDGQNDPTDLPQMLSLAQASDTPPLVAGIRVRRDDPVSRLIATRIANGIRSTLLGDHCPDTGCGVKLFRREDFLLLPCFEGMHRFLPALFQRYGHPLINHPVRHRARLKGVSKYSNLGRAAVGVFDLVGVAWLVRRTRPPEPAPRFGGARSGA